MQHVGEDGWLMLGEKLVHLDQVTFIDLGENAALYLAGGASFPLTRIEAVTITRWVRDFGGVALVGKITRLGELEQ